MIDTVKYFNIIPCDITKFRLKFLYGLITDITFHVLMFTSTFTLPTKSIGKMIRISTVMVADFISMFIIEFVNM